jgi:hypothetical protein
LAQQAEWGVGVVDVIVGGIAIVDAAEGGSAFLDDFRYV